VYVGRFTAILEKCVVDCALSLASGFPAKTTIGHNVTIEAGSVLRSATVDDLAWVGCGSTVLDGALLETKCKLLPGTLVEAGGRIPANEIWVLRGVFFEPLRRLQSCPCTA